MGKLYELDEAIMLAECELKYFMDLIVFFEKSGYYNLFEDRFLRLKLFRNDFYIQIDEVKYLLETNRAKFSRNRNKTLLRNLLSRCDTLRDCFNELHTQFIKLIDDTIQKRTARHAKQILGTLVLGEKSMSNFMTNEDDKKHLENLTETLKVNNERLIKKLKKINKAIAGMGVHDICEDLSPNLNQEQYDNFMAQVNHFYSTQLVDLHDRITSKFNYAFSTTKTPNGACEEILKVRDKSNIIRYYSSNSLWGKHQKENKADENKTLDSIINYIRVNLQFFIAPFIHRKFQYWGREHFDELREISDELKKYLNTNTLRDIFYEALELLSEEGEDLLLRDFLGSMKGTGFLEFLEHCIACPYPIIDEWNYYATFNLR